MGGTQLAPHGHVNVHPTDDQGLSSEAAARRRAEVGSNTVPETPPTKLWRRLLRQFASPLIYVLLFAVAFDVAIAVWGGATAGRSKAPSSARCWC
jgi:magnesium-transporting ATPase (P-type)